MGDGEGGGRAGRGEGGGRVAEVGMGGRAVVVPFLSHGWGDDCAWSVECDTHTLRPRVFGAAR